MRKSKQEKMWRWPVEAGCQAEGKKWKEKMVRKVRILLTIHSFKVK